MSIMALLFPYLLSVVLASAVMSIYGFTLLSVLTPAVLFGCFATFAVCYFTQRHKFIGGIAIFIYIVSALRIVVFCARMGRLYSGVYFWQWVLTMGDGAENNGYFLGGILVAATVFIGIIVYYFSIVQYRIAFLTLSSLLPCVLYIKVMAEMDNVYLILIAGFNLAIHILHSFNINTGGSFKRLAGKEAYAFAGILFGFILVLVAALVPKKEEAVFYDRFEDLFLNGDTTSALSGNFSDISVYSGNADNYKSISNRRLYTLYGTEAVYLKRQNFDLYDYENNRWYSLYSDGRSEVHYIPDEWKYEKELLQYTMLQNAVGRASDLSPEFINKYGLQNMAKSAYIADPLQKIYIHSENFGAKYYLAAPRIVSVDVQDFDEFYATASGNFYRTEGLHAPDCSYEISFYDNYGAVDEWVGLGAADYDNTEALNMLSELYNIIAEDDDYSAKSVEAFIGQQEYADKYREAVNDNTAKIPMSIKNLALEITKNDTYDWQKAGSIADYFHVEDFVYDIEYNAPDDSPEYFLFESRRGTCSDFASAYVLLARAAGLTVRYTEGYVPEKASGDRYYINESNSHAYPEVFIQNVGWMVYEPTVSSAADSHDGWFDFAGDVNFDYGLVGVIFSFGIVIVLIIGFIKIIVPVIVECVYRIMILLSPPERAVMIIYKRLVKKATRQGIKDAESLTPGEFADMLLQVGCDIRNMVIMLEWILYADNMSSINTENMPGRTKIFKSYKAALKGIKKIKP